MYFSYFELRKKKKKKKKKKTKQFLKLQIKRFFDSFTTFPVFISYVYVYFMSASYHSSIYCIFLHQLFKALITIVQLKQHEQMKPMFYSIHKRNKSAISMNDFNPWIIFLLSLSGIKKPSPVLSLLWRPNIKPEYCREIKFVHLNFQA